MRRRFGNQFDGLPFACGNWADIVSTFRVGIVDVRRLAGIVEDATGRDDQIVGTRACRNRQQAGRGDRCVPPADPVYTGRILVVVVTDIYDL